MTALRELKPSRCGAGACAGAGQPGLDVRRRTRCPPGRRRGSPVVPSRCGTGACGRAVQPGCGVRHRTKVSPRTSQKQSGGTVSLRNRGMRLAQRRLDADLGPKFSLQQNTDLPGGDLTRNGIKGVTISACQAICHNDPNCKAFSWVRRSSWCWPKGRLTSTKRKFGVVSGIRR